MVQGFGQSLISSTHTVQIARRRTKCQLLKKIQPKAVNKLWYHQVNAMLSRHNMALGKTSIQNQCKRLFSGLELTVEFL